MNNHHQQTTPQPGFSQKMMLQAMLLTLVFINVIIIGGIFMSDFLGSGPVLLGNLIGLLVLLEVAGAGLVYVVGKQLRQLEALPHPA